MRCIVELLVFAYIGFFILRQIYASSEHDRKQHV